MAIEVTIIQRDRMAYGVGKVTVSHYGEAIHVVEKHFVDHPDGYVELGLGDRHRYAFYREQAIKQLHEAWVY